MDAAERPDRARRSRATIHSDIARGFIRCEVISAEDMVEAGSHAEAAKRGTQRLEGKVPTSSPTATCSTSASTSEPGCEAAVGLTQLGVGRPYVRLRRRWSGQLHVLATAVNCV